MKKRDRTRIQKRKNEAVKLITLIQKLAIKEKGLRFYQVSKKKILTRKIKNLKLKLQQKLNRK
jgi:hypothetical protein